jgi:hypothetical protein
MPKGDAVSQQIIVALWRIKKKSAAYGERPGTQRGFAEGMGEPGIGDTE